MENRFEPPQLDSSEQYPPVQTPHQASQQHAVKRKRLLLWMGIGGAVLLVAIGTLLWFVLAKPDAKESKTPAPKDSGQTETPPSQTPADPTQVTYKSAKLNIELTHRKDWTLKESTTGEITLTSPSTTLTKANATSGSNVFTLKIRKGAPEAMKSTIEKAVAVRDSEVIAYSAPTESQRYYTNISYAGSGDTFKFLIVTGSVALKTGNPFAYTLTLGDDTYLIAGGYGADKSGTLSFDPITIGSLDTPVKEQALDIIESVKIF